ncbi:exopolysaccharide biosynthesis polyprenyl glycosylphosphotransferase [Methylobacterium sp. SyP6R]|uniref:exopolysaccharide biosynthesis polyprenyl glycosylphosphotransferase n=1 Tax=Methylobacterium sp. SyP6R TaxID=2718876 RepID=UPI001EFFC3FD|nr:exopolysaccharide biosynthesis polyprenyl glycosylphosphotransferase [Methylobacterium sp. SyP6R]MCF4124798.1 exopolysaccharide biosynthesis polyprenyl glycosylphosphotransferase [Methylobacterium sp. SyP6R]
MTGRSGLVGGSLAGSGLGGAVPAGGLALLLAPGLLAPGVLAQRHLALAPPVEAGTVPAVARSRPAIPARPGAGPVVKRAVDVVGAALGLVLLLPLFLVVAVLIKCDSRGPVLFRQSRIGLGNRPFRVWKFRTMTCCENGSVVRQARRDDPRVTRVGRVLRRTSLDELPQLVNVLLGSMSLVGPRPHAVAHDAQFTGTVARYADRHAVRPGITGWAQVRGCRGETPNAAAMQRRVDLDLAYIEHWSLLLDLIILAMTLREIFRSQAAY